MKSKKAIAKWASKTLKTCKCKSAIENKYKSRPSPACHAEDCKDSVMQGNDKKYYISKPDSRNIYKWIPMTHIDDRKPGKGIYYTHDNGSNPFKVVVKGKELHLYGCMRMDDWDAEYVYYDFINSFKCNKIFIGNDPEKVYDDVASKHPGNSIIAEIGKNKYLFIGESVYEFETSSPITMFRSPIGNNDVPYPFAQDDTLHI